MFKKIICLSYPCVLCRGSDCLVSKMSLETLLGGKPINRFPNEPTHRDVLLFYSRFWNTTGSDSSKERNVAQELIRVYGERNIQVLNELTIKNKIKRSVSQLKKILKFQRKTKTAENVRFENEFISRLGEVFEVRRTSSVWDSEVASGSGNSTSTANELLVQNFANGILNWKFQHVWIYFIWHCYLV